MAYPKTARHASRAAVHVRTQELAALAGRVHPQVSQADYEQAKREITGETDTERQNAVLDSPSVTASIAVARRERRN